MALLLFLRTETLPVTNSSRSERASSGADAHPKYFAKIEDFSSPPSPSSAGEKSRSTIRCSRNGAPDSDGIATKLLFDADKLGERARVPRHKTSQTINPGEYREGLSPVR